MDTLKINHMEKIPIAPLPISQLSRDSIKLALKVAHVHDLMEEEQQLSAAKALNLDEETRQKIQDLCHNFSTRP